jgi:hypothetical protein
MTPEDEERLRREDERRRDEAERELERRERIAEQAGVPLEHPAVARFAREREELRADGGLRPLGGAGGERSRIDGLLALLLAGYATEQLRGLRREVAARLAELPLGSEDSRRLGALSRAIRRELARRAGGPGRAA